MRKRRRRRRRHIINICPCKCTYIDKKWCIPVFYIDYNKFSHYKDRVRSLAINYLVENKAIIKQVYWNYASSKQGCVNLDILFKAPDNFMPEYIFICKLDKLLLTELN